MNGGGTAPLELCTGKMCAAVMMLQFLLLCSPLLADPGLFPPWDFTWNMSLSTVFMPCDANGVGPVPFPPSQAAAWGIADFDCSFCQHTRRPNFPR